MISNTTVKNKYTGNGTTTSWPIPFAYTDTSQIKVKITVDDTETVLSTSDYTIDGTAVAVIYPKTSSTASPIDSSTTLTVYRVTGLTQESDLTNQGAAWPETIESSLDKLTEIVQEQSETLDRCAKVKISSSDDPEELMTTLATEVKEAIAASEESATSETNAATSATAAATSATNAANSATAAATSATNAETSNTNSATSATAAANSATAAAASAATAFGAAAAAWSSTTTYNFPDVVAYTDGQTYRCVGSSVVGDIPSESSNWVRITLTTDDFFVVDSEGFIVPSTNPSYSLLFKLDSEGYIVPKEAN